MAIFPCANDRAISALLANIFTRLSVSTFELEKKRVSANATVVRTVAETLICEWLYN